MAILFDSCDVIYSMMMLIDCSEIEFRNLVCIYIVYFKFSERFSCYIIMRHIIIIITIIIIIITITIIIVI